MLRREAAISLSLFLLIPGGGPCSLACFKFSRCSYFSASSSGMLRWLNLPESFKVFKLVSPVMLFTLS